MLPRALRGQHKRRYEFKKHSVSGESSVRVEACFQGFSRTRARVQRLDARRDRTPGVTQTLEIKPF
jgi:hypothetical protein